MAEKTPAQPVKIKVKRDSSVAHPLWSGNPAQLVRDRQWREDIPMAAADGDIEPSFVRGVAPPDEIKFHVR